MEFGNEISVYPNPANERVTIKSGSSIQQLEIYNQIGQLEKQIITSSNLVNLNVSEFDSGIYFIKVFSHENVITKKLVIE